MMYLHSDLFVVLFIDLLSKYAVILPPTLAKKKRESERKVPIRKHTRPMDMRMSRSRISAGADLKELQAQALAQRGIKVKSPPPVPPVPPIPDQAVSSNASGGAQQQPSPDQSTASEAPVVTVTDEPEAMLHDEPAEVSHEEIAVVDNRSPDPMTEPSVSESVNYSEIPPPPPLAPRTPDPVVQAPVPKQAGVPAFKEPPPENYDDFPPRPTFKAPPPEAPESPELPAPSFPEPQVVPRSESPPLPMPSFKDPPPEPASPPAFPSSAVSPSAMSPASLGRATSPKSASSRSQSPSKGAALSRNSSTTSNTRGPRVAARGPRTGGGSVSSMVNSFNNRSSISSNSSAVRPTSPVTSGARSPSRPSSQVKRSSASRASMFERRTMHSDAEDEVIQ